MKILMLGWEYPPHISGGLGTACEGLTLGLARQKLEITFIVPSLWGDETSPHMSLVGVTKQEEKSGSSSTQKYHGMVTSRVIKSSLKPYLTQTQYTEYLNKLSRMEGMFTSVRELSAQHYGADIFEEVERYAREVTELFAGHEFDLIHAHDWMTFPAAVALARVTGKPLVVHIHSLESDRSGHNRNPRIHYLEGLGICEADAVIAVSYYTRAQIHEQHKVSLEKIHVVHNGVYPREALQTYRRKRQWPEKLVLFLGRVTFQKGPEYFVEAAAKVLPHVKDVLFVMAGSGDLLNRMVSRVQELGIQDNFLFPGFLKGQEVEEMFSLADLYVMPSVSEPFGISALEAINFDTPVIISRQSGVSEVLSHALKVDFWDIDKMADLIINALIYPELRHDMVGMAREEVKRIHWDASALKTIEVYRSVQVPH